MMTDRAWNQIQAALRFWLETWKSSPTPPWMHPAVRPFFEDDRPSMLTPDEIEAIINSDPVEAHCYGYPISAMANLMFIPKHRIARWLQALGFKPSGRAGRADLYAWDDLMHAVNTILGKDRNFKERYADSVATPSNPTQGDQPA